MFFFIYKRYLWIKNATNGIKEGPINSFISKINSRIDAAYWHPQHSTTFLFSGTDHHWSSSVQLCTRHHLNILHSIHFHTGSSFWTVKGSPMKCQRKKITSFGFPASVDHIDAAVHVPNTGHTLFFTRDQYWRYVIDVQESYIIVCTSYLFGVFIPLDTMRMITPWKNLTHTSSQMFSQALRRPSVQLFISMVGKQTSLRPILSQIVQWLVY